MNGGCRSASPSCRHNRNQIAASTTTTTLLLLLPSPTTPISTFVAAITSNRTTLQKACKSTGKLNRRTICRTNATNAIENGLLKQSQSASSSLLSLSSSSSSLSSSSPSSSSSSSPSSSSECLCDTKMSNLIATSTLCRCCCCCAMQTSDKWQPNHYHYHHKDRQKHRHHHHQLHEQRICMSSSQTKLRPVSTWSRRSQRWPCWSWLLLLLLANWCTVFSVNSSTEYNAPSDCEWSPLSPSTTTTTSTADTNSGKFSVICRLRVMNTDVANSAIRRTNLSLVRSNRTVRLTIICDDFLVMSSLSNGSFNHLKELEELNIDKCKLSEIPSDALTGLNRLRNLTIRTSNDDWGELSLRFQATALATLTALERIELSRNSLKYLQPILFCGQTRLQQLNLSRNAFVEVSHVGFSARSQNALLHRSGASSALPALPCKFDALTHLDLSRNRLKVLTDRGFFSLTNLRILDLSHNQISRAEESSLTGLDRLTQLDLSNNELIALPPRFFQSVQKTLTELYLHNNTITVLPKGIFAGLSQLRVLDLSRNDITSHWIGLDTFPDLLSLESLDLSYNRLSKIDAVTFRSQLRLENLYLNHNDIESIADHAFDAMHRLQTLVLSYNRLTSIDAWTLTGLSGLNMLALDNNAIASLHPDAFANLTFNLMELNVSSNLLETVPESLIHLHSLRNLELSFNRIANISLASYQGKEHLYGLNLEGNRIRSLNKGAFRDLPSLKILNLAQNRIRAIEEDTFEDVPDLHALRLDSNRLTNINNLFGSLRYLLLLNISANDINVFDYAQIPIGLQWLDLHQNRIELLENHFQLQSVLKLRTLDCSRNRITEIESASLPDSIELVYLNENSLAKIAPLTFAGKQNLTRVDLSSNRLQTLDFNAFRLSPVLSRKPLPEFSIANNPYICDCSMEWVKKLSDSSDDLRRYPRLVDLDKVRCALAFSKRSGQVPLKDATSDSFLCPYKSHCFALCHCCEFDACDCEMTCPENCTCFYGESWNSNIVDCSNRQHSVVPPRIPMDVTELYLDGTLISSLSSHTFIGRKNLNILLLNNSRISVINNRTFNGLRALQVLNLNHNQLVTLSGYEFERLNDLRELYLSYNRLVSISNQTFLALKSLQILHLDHNHISTFHLWTLNVHNNQRLVQLRLGHNAWSCGCGYLDQLLDWTGATTAAATDTRPAMIIEDASHFECIYNETLNLPLIAIDFNRNACIPHSSANMLNAAPFQVEYYVPIFVISGVVMLIIIFLVLVVLIYRQEMSVWFYSKCGLRLTGRGRAAHRGGFDDEDKLYDAFISYSKKDEAFVAQTLAPELECVAPEFRLCLHYRDLPVASGYLSDAIVEAMEASRRVIIVISENFLKGEWCRYEFKAAHLEVLHAVGRRSIINLTGGGGISGGTLPLPLSTAANRASSAQLMLPPQLSAAAMMNHTPNNSSNSSSHSSTATTALSLDNKLIIVILGKLNSKDLDPDIRLWLKTSTVLQWDEKLFWEKLRYAMPDVAYTRKLRAEQTRDANTIAMHI